jgi:chromosomal replication initiator protein
LTNLLWKNVLTDLEKKINKQSFTTWLKDTEPVSLNGDILQIKVKDDVAVRHLNDRYLKDIEEILESTTGKKYSCNFITEIESKDIKTSNIDTINTTDNQHNKAENNNSMLNENYTFENFVVGDSNKIAHAAARSVATSPATQYNPLFIYGDSGLGKTHLIQAIGQHILKERPWLKVLYIPTEQFINEFIYILSFKALYTSSFVLFVFSAIVFAIQSIFFPSINVILI